MNNENSSNTYTDNPTETVEIELSEDSYDDTIKKHNQAIQQELLLFDSSRREYFLAKLGIVSLIYWGFLAFVLFYM